MAVESAHDLAALLDDFGEPVCGAGSLRFTAIVDDEYVELQGIDGTRPVLTCAANDVCSVESGDSLLLRGGVYRVVAPEPDGTGIVRLILERQ